MIRVFGETDKIFNSNGDIVLHPLKAKVHKEDNGDFYLNLECGLEYADYITQGRIIVANTPQGDQAFRIGDVQKTKSKIRTQAWHVFYDAEQYVIADSAVIERNCNYALDHFNSATDQTSPFTTISDVITLNSYRCVRKSLAEAVQTVLERWGGHLVRNNWQIAIRESIGADNGVTVRYAKNLQDISCTEDWSKVVTKLMPVGTDGILLNKLDPNASVYLYSDWQYDIPYTKVVKFKQDIDSADYATETDYINALLADLQYQAEQYLSIHYLPEVNYTLKANLEVVTDIGDTVEVIDSRLGINLMTNVTAYEYDCILQRYTEVVFGNYRQTINGLMGTINANTEDLVQQEGEVIKVQLGEQLEQATAQILGMMGSSYVIYDGNQIMVVDKLPKETAVNVMRINAGGIGFSNTGINGTFNSAWTIDGTLNMQNINVINLVADLIKGGTLKLGSDANVSGLLELYDEANNLIGQMDKDGLKMFGTDGSYVLMNNTVGFAGYDRNDNPIYWVSADEFHMKKSVVEEEITLCGKLRFIPITIESGNVVVNDGIGLVSSATGGA